MNYRYAPDLNHQDFASGRVFYTSPGQPAFPVRLASEIFQRCFDHWQRGGGSGSCTLFDPTCGGAYWLIAIAYLHWDRVSKILAMDIDEQGIALAKRNLSLLTLEGLDRRIAEIERLLANFGKTSHAEALKSAHRLRKTLCTGLQSHGIQATTFRGDALQTDEIKTGLDSQVVDILLADVPYGWNTNWQQQEEDEGRNAVDLMLTALIPVLSPSSVIAIAADKQQKIQRKGYQRLERFQVGKRRIEILGLE